MSYLRNKFRGLIRLILLPFTFYSRRRFNRVDLTLERLAEQQLQMQQMLSASNEKIEEIRNLVSESNHCVLSMNHFFYERLEHLLLMLEADARIVVDAYSQYEDSLQKRQNQK